MCLQANVQERNVGRYYKRLGFSHVIPIDSDNGLSHTSDDFRSFVAKNPELWDSTSLHLFLLCRGKIILRNKATIDLTLTNMESDSSKDKIFVEFPWPTSNMNKIESCVRSQPLLSHFSLSRLVETDRPYHYLIDKSTMKGSIHESVWKSRASNHWLSTAEIQLLFAVMMRNTTETKFVHFFSLTTTMMMKETYELYVKVKRDPKEEWREKLKGHLQYLRDYVECMGDLFEHKFLVFICNPSSFHWNTYVMVNPSVIYLRGENSNRPDGKQGQFAGWSVFDSLGYSRTNLPTTKKKGLMPTMDCKFDVSTGVRFFLNFAAMYLYSKEDSENRKKSVLLLKLQCPFGDHTSTQPCDKFPRFDGPYPSIILQSDAFNCGFAAFANALAFVKHLEKVPFEKDNLKKVDAAHNHLSDIHDLRPLSSREPAFNVSWLLTELRKEHETFIPELSVLYRSEIKERERSMKESRDRNIYVKEKETRDNLTKLLREEKTDEDKGECIVNYLLTLGETHEKKATLSCKKCLTSFYSGFQFPVPTNYDTIRWKLISESPKSILSRKDLEEIIGKHVKYIDEPQKMLFALGAYIMFKYAWYSSRTHFTVWASSAT